MKLKLDISELNSIFFWCGVLCVAAMQGGSSIKSRAERSSELE